MESSLPLPPPVTPITGGKNLELKNKSYIEDI